MQLLLRKWGLLKLDLSSRVRDVIVSVVFISAVDLISSFQVISLKLQAYRLGKFSVIMNWKVCLLDFTCSFRHIYNF